MSTMPVDPRGANAAPAPFRPRTPVVIGIVGGIAAGKSAVAERFAAHGLRRVDADQHARSVSERPEVLAEVENALGPGLVVDGHLDRAAIAALVFRDPGARAKLEAILHPRIRAAVLTELAHARRAGESVLLDVPLLLEGGLVAECQHVVFVDAPDAVRERRAAGRGWTPDELARREAAQLPLAQKRARADFVIDNSGERATMHAQVQDLLARLQRAP